VKLRLMSGLRMSGFLLPLSLTSSWRDVLVKDSDDIRFNFNSVAGSLWYGDVYRGSL
jgi:hypothetical protein